MRIISLASRTAALCKAVGPQKRCVPNGGRILDKKNYKKLAESASKGSPIMKNCLCAFLFGGAICAAAQGPVSYTHLVYEKGNVRSGIFRFAPAVRGVSENERLLRICEGNNYGEFQTREGLSLIHI